MGNYFVAIDVETANASRASICQIGLVASDGENELWRWSSLVDPEEGFESKNVQIHHIHPRHVVGAPRFPMVLQATGASLEGRCVVSWSDFDQDAVTQAAAKYEALPPNCLWLDACSVARHVWPNLPNYKLSTVAATLGIEFNHHDALADAWACCQIFQSALAVTDTSVEHWLERIGQRSPAVYAGPVEIRYEESCGLEGDVSGPLYGHVLLPTGDFTSGKQGFSRLAAELGCTVKENWSKKITLLVVGHRDPDQFEGVEKSTKHRQAEEAQQAGHPVAILTEQQFMDWVAALERQQQTA